MVAVESIVNGFKKDLTGKTGRQVSTLFLSQILALILGVFTGIINTRILGPVDYGILAFFLTITSFTVLFFRFGFFSASGLLIAQEKDERKERELIGASIIVAFLIGLLYSFFILLLSFFVDEIFGTNISWILRYTSILLITLPFSFLIPEIGRGTNKIGKLSIFNLIPQVIYILGMLMLLKIIQISIFHLILLKLFTTIISIFVVTYSFHPLFTNIRKNLNQIWKETKEYGFDVYQGEIVNQTTYNLDGIFITYFVNTTQLGFYSLAVSITSPISAFSSALSTSLFKGFTNMDRIPKKVIHYNFVLLATCVVGLTIFGKSIVVLLFTEKFLPTIPLILPLALAGFFQGMYQPYSFLAAKGKGKWIKNVAYTEAVSNIIGNVFLIYFFGAYGAAVASAVSRFVNWIMLRYYYGRFIREGNL
jgi:O-antigen/teichoic acid export membrane protein